MNSSLAQLNWTAGEIKQLRCRLGWSCAELARNLKLELETVMGWERGHDEPALDHRHSLLNILHQAESNAERMQRRPIAEIMMRNRGLCQIHDLEVIDGLEHGKNSSRDS